MTYEELNKKYPKKQFGPISVLFAREWKDDEYVDAGWQFELGHSCDAWVIGNREDAISFAENLKKAIEYTLTQERKTNEH